MSYHSKIISQQQLEIDNISYYIVKINRLVLVQSICDFNVFWLDSISPIIVDDTTLDFLIANRNEFKRKLTVREFISYDSIIKHLTPRTFDEFKKIILDN